MLDETIVTETPPLYNCYSRVGQQKCIPITGSRAKRIVHGALNIHTGDVTLLITKTWTQITHEDFLSVVRSHWRGWQIVLFEDRGSPHTADDSQEYVAQVGIEVRWLPRATPELNAMDQLWRHAKREALSDCPTRSVDESALALCQYVIDLSPKERLRQAGVLSGNFWLMP
jgi:transposase